MWKCVLIWAPLYVCTVKVCLSVQDSHGHVESAARLAHSPGKSKQGTLTVRCHAVAWGGESHNQRLSLPHWLLLEDRSSVELPVWSALLASPGTSVAVFLLYVRGFFLWIVRIVHGVRFYFSGLHFLFVFECPKCMAAILTFSAYI